MCPLNPLVVLPFEFVVNGALSVTVLGIGASGDGKHVSLFGDGADSRGIVTLVRLTLLLC